MYFSDTQLIKALKLLEKAHIFFGVTFLVCKQAGLPVGHAIEFAINQEEKLFLEKALGH